MRHKPTNDIERADLITPVNLDELLLQPRKRITSARWPTSPSGRRLVVRASML
jgi:hypothetical protein